MQTLFRWLLRLSIGLIVGLVLILTGIWYFAIRSLPDHDATYQVNGISAPVEIVRTTDSVPHIFGQEDADVFFALGLAHAQDRLFQMVVLRRSAQGRLAEIFGARALPGDDLARRLGFYRNAQAAVAAQDAQTQAALSAYAAGVNQWIAQVNMGARGRGAPEFFLFNGDIAYWEPADSLAILNLLAAEMSGQAAAEVMRARLSLVAPARGQDLVRTGPEPALPSYASLFRGIGPMNPGAVTLPDPGSSYATPGIGASANGWAAGPARTAAGGAILANDPQMPLTMPSLWYLARIELRAGGVIGATIPGIPAILSGRNPNLAWGITPAQIDDADIFIEEVEPGNPDRYRSEAGWTPFSTRREVIGIRGEPARAITLRETRNGPVLTGGHFGLSTITPPGHVAVLSWTGSAPGNRAMSSLIGLMTATNRREAARVLEGVQAPALVVTLADGSGIGQVLAGVAPERGAENQTGGRMPQPGWLPQNRWLGLRTAPLHTEMPAGDGMVLATGAALPVTPVLGYDWGDTQRIQRLRRLMELREVHTRESFIDAQLDTVSPAARNLLPLAGADLWFTGEPAAPGTPMRQRQDALTLLAEWDGNMSEHLPEPLIYTTWMAELQRRLIRDELGPLAEGLTSLRPDFIERVFRNIDGAGAWCDVVQSAPVEDCATISRQALDAAILDLSARFGPDVTSWRWGDEHLAVQRHPGLGDAPGLGWIVNLTQSVSGGDFTLARTALSGRAPDPWQATTGAGYRGVYDLGDPDSSVFIISTGQSGHPLSRHYDDLAELWRRGEYIPMSLDSALARAGAEGITLLEPAPATPAP